MGEAQGGRNVLQSLWEVRRVELNKIYEMGGSRLITLNTSYPHFSLWQPRELDILRDLLLLANCIRACLALQR